MNISLSSYLHYFGSMLNIFVSAIVSLIISNNLGRSAYAEYSIYMSFSTGCIVLGSLGIPSYLQTFLPRAKRTITKLILQGIIVRLTISLILAFLVLLFLEINTILFYALIISGIFVSILMDMALIVKGHLSTVFYVKLINNFMKLGIIIYAPLGIEGLLTFFALFDFFGSLIAYHSAKFDSPLPHKKNGYKKLFTFYNKFYPGHISSSLSFFSSPYFFIIGLTLLLGKDEANIVAGFAFIFTMGYFVFNSISLTSRFEQVMVAKFIKGLKPDIVGVVRLSSCICAAVGSVLSVHSNAINEFILENQYNDTINFLYLIFVSAVVNGISYAYSPQIYKLGRLRVLKISSAIGMLCSVLTIGVAWIFFGTGFFYSILFFGNILISAAKVSTLAMLMRDECSMLSKNLVYVLIQAFVAFGLVSSATYISLNFIAFSSSYGVFASIACHVLISSVVVLFILKVEYRFRLLGI